jgi:NitT/TauT family transport system substrate-binding protein
VSSPHVRSGALPRFASTLAVAVAGSLLLAACGGGSSTAAPSNTADGTTAITVLRSTGSTFEPLYIAESQGFFKAAGLTVTIKEGAADTSQNAPSVMNGEAQFGQTDSSGFLKAAAQGMGLQIVSGLQSSDTGKPSDGLIVKADSPIQTIADIAGKTVGLPALGGTIQFICMYLAQQAGIDPKSIKFVALPVAGLNDAVANGQVDAGYTFATFLDAAKAAGMRTIGEGTNSLPGIPQAVLFANTDWLSKNAETAKKFTDAVAQGIAYANANPDAVRAVDTQYTKLPADYIKIRSIQPLNATINTTVLKTVADGMFEFGLITKAVDTSTIVWSKASTSS